MGTDRYQYNFDERILSPGEKEIVRVVFTIPLHEWRFYDFCVKHDIVCYLPLRKVIRCKRQTYGSKDYQYQNVVLRPMFPSYAFVKLLPEQCTEIFRSNSIVRILGGKDELSEQLLHDIQLVHQIETIAMTEEVEFNADIKEGGKFLIESGPWQGVYGWLQKKRKKSLWTVEIECLNTLVRATIDPTQYKMTPVNDD